MQDGTAIVTALEINRKHIAAPMRKRSGFANESSLRISDAFGREALFDTAFVVALITVASVRVYL